MSELQEAHKAALISSSTALGQTPAELQDDGHRATEEISCSCLSPSFCHVQQYIITHSAAKDFGSLCSEPEENKKLITLMMTVTITYSDMAAVSVTTENATEHIIHIKLGSTSVLNSISAGHSFGG